MFRIVLMLLLLAPLQWFAFGPLRLHLGVFILTAAVGAALLPRRAYALVLAPVTAFVVANGFVDLVWILTNAYNGLGFRDPIEALVLLACFCVLATMVGFQLRMHHGRDIRPLWFAAPGVCATLLAALTYSLIANGVNPAQTVVTAVSSGDPTYLQRELYKSAFAGFGLQSESVLSQLRHEVFGAVLLAMCVTSVARHLHHPRSRAIRVLITVSMSLGVLLILVSVSRSTILAALVWPVLIAYQRIRRGAFSGSALLAIAGVAAALAVLAATGILAFVWTRFTSDTTSYSARGRLLDAAYANLESSAFAGGVETAGASSHNVILDTWLRSGVIAAGAMLFVVILVIALFIRLALRLHLEPDWMLPVVMMMALPIVRMFTAGGGLITPVSWIALALVAGFVSYRIAIAEAREQPPIAGVAVVRR